ncbi:zinc finger protein 462-like [Arapaima gigas]
MPVDFGIWGAESDGFVLCIRGRYSGFSNESLVMEVLQCDGCDFRAESYDDLKAHIQGVHTAFLQPTAVSDSFNRLEDEEDLAPLNNEYGSPCEQPGSQQD